MACDSASVTEAVESSVPRSQASVQTLQAHLHVLVGDLCEVGSTAIDGCHKHPSKTESKDWWRANEVEEKSRKCVPSTNACFPNSQRSHLILLTFPAFRLPLCLQDSFTTRWTCFGTVVELLTASYHIDGNSPMRLLNLLMPSTMVE